MPHLPQTITPEYSTKLISSGATVKYRPFLVKEEKLLLMAGEKNNPQEMFEAIKRVLNECTFNKVNIEELPMFDIEHLFIQIRAKSVGETVTPIINCPHCNKGTEIKIDVTKAEVRKHPDHNRVVTVDEANGVSIVMRYPSFNTLSGKNKALTKFMSDDNKAETHVYDMIVNCIETIIIRNKDTGKDDVYHATETPREDIENFVENLTSGSFKKIETFFKTMPEIFCKIDFKCPECKENSVLEVKNLNDFFGS